MCNNWTFSIKENRCAICGKIGVIKAKMDICDKFLQSFNTKEERDKYNG
ncbi:hypothetical protein HMPREF1430_00234 [Helicobacter pylori GAM96Ai]|nr:hypothetical protein HMPREF1430_00234 [Helicobacter pylori GAM96Ai]